jgi:hypothetical protein
MPTLHDVIREVRGTLERELHERLRNRLMNQPKEWLVEQLLAHAQATGGAPAVPPPAPPPQPIAQETELERAARRARIASMRLDETRLQELIERFNSLGRERLEAEGYLLQPPAKGLELITPAQRGDKGNALLREAKDLLFALLFGEEQDQVRLERRERELLTITLPRNKTSAIAFIMLAATEIGSEGTWRDPQNVSNDARAANTLLQVEYGEVKSERVGHGITAALRMINNLEVNEQILYARMENVEQSTLIE